MKKFKFLLFTFMLLVISTMSILSSCDEAKNDKIAENNIGNKTTNDTTHHHEWSEWSITKQASCTKDGFQERTCNCGKKESETLEAKGHTEVIDPAIASTCTKVGTTEGKHCSTCGTILKEQTTIKAKGHSSLNGKCSVCDMDFYDELINLLKKYENKKYVLTTSNGLQWYVYKYDNVNYIQVLYDDGYATYTLYIYKSGVKSQTYDFRYLCSQNSLFAEFGEIHGKLDASQFPSSSSLKLTDYDFCTGSEAVKIMNRHYFQSGFKNLINNVFVPFLQTSESNLSALDYGFMNY